MELQHDRDLQPQALHAHSCSESVMVREGENAQDLNVNEKSPTSICSPCAVGLCLLCPRKNSLWQGKQSLEMSLSQPGCAAAQLSVPAWLSWVTRHSVPTRWLQRLWHGSEHAQPSAQGLKVPQKHVAAASSFFQKCNSLWHLSKHH